MNSILCHNDKLSQYKYSLLKNDLDMINEIVNDASSECQPISAEINNLPEVPTSNSEYSQMNNEDEDDEDDVKNITFGDRITHLLSLCTCRMFDNAFVYL